MTMPQMPNDDFEVKSDGKSAVFSEEQTVIQEETSLFGHQRRSRFHTCLKYAVLLVLSVLTNQLVTFFIVYKNLQVEYDPDEQHYDAHATENETLTVPPVGADVQDSLSPREDSSDHERRGRRLQDCLRWERKTLTKSIPGLLPLSVVPRGFTTERITLGNYPCNLYVSWDTIRYDWCPIRFSFPIPSVCAPSLELQFRYNQPSEGTCRADFERAVRRAMSLTLFTMDFPPSVGSSISDFMNHMDLQLRMEGFHFDIYDKFIDSVGWSASVSFPSSQCMSLWTWN